MVEHERSDSIEDWGGKIPRSLEFGYWVVIEFKDEVDDSSKSISKSIPKSVPNVIFKKGQKKWIQEDWSLIIIFVLLGSKEFIRLPW